MKEEVVLQVAAKTSVGRIRELNEDNFIVTNNISGADWFLPADAYANGAMGTVMVIADGMGGTNAGEVASRIAVDSVQKYFNALSSSPVKAGRMGAILKDSILYAHKAIVNHAVTHRETEGMGTTLVLCWIVGGKAYVGWSGDSRCYAWHPGRGLRQLSKDHSYVQSLIDEGKITTEEAFLHPQNNIVLQSLGDGSVEPEPDVVEARIAKDDLLLLCSDGLSGMLTDAEMEEILRATEGDVGVAVSLLIDRANEAGGADNITVVVAKVLENTMPETNDEKEEEEGRKGARKKRGRGRMFGLAGLAVIAIGLAAYSYIHSRQKDPVVQPPGSHGAVDSSGPGKNAPRDSGAPAKQVPAASPSASPAGAKPKNKNRQEDASGDPSTIRTGGQTNPDKGKTGDGHPGGEAPGGKGGGADSSKHVHDAREIVRPGAPVPAGGGGKPPKPGKKDSTQNNRSI